MCLISFAYKCIPNYKLILIANRDEFFDRPTKSAYDWGNGIIGGQDLKSGGMWFGLHKSGKFAAITNYRNGFDKREFKTSRGSIVKGFLNFQNSAEEYANLLKQNKNEYAGYNLIFGDINKILYYSNIEDKITTIQSGIHGLSNAFLNSSWPKVDKAKEFFDVMKLNNEKLNREKIFSFMVDESKASKNLLPKTGINEELEYQLSSIFIRLPNYGTRATTLLTIDSDDRIEFRERTYSFNKNEYSDRIFKIKKPE